MTDSNLRSVHILYLPHATTFDNESNTATGTAEVGISPLGHSQIKLLHEVMQDQELAAVFCSDLQRAIETAEGIFGDRHKIIVDPRLREINIGELTGESTQRTALVQKQWITEGAPGGESYQDIEKKTAAFLEDLQDAYAGKAVAVIGHQATQLALEVLIHHVSWEEAIDKDWRNTHAFQNGWTYELMQP